MKDPVFCTDCVYFRPCSDWDPDPTYGDESCTHPDNFYEKPTYDGMKKYIHWLPVKKNKNADCPLYEKKRPSWVEKFLGIKS